MRECDLCKNCFPDSVDKCPNDGMPTKHTISGEPVLEGKYHIELRIGQGGMGVVYKARHSFLRTLHAIKIILPDLVGNDPQLVTRFRQEALAAAAIRHQNVVNVSDYGVIDGSVPFLVMEYVDGESLHDLLAVEKKLSPERAFELMSAICAGVGAAHHQGIVHRDLKPLNVMICRDKPDLAQAVKILDFGLAKIKSGELLGSFIQAQTTGLMGSPYYMAPEQWEDRDPDTRADIYSVGVMLYQMLAGDVPFKGSSIPAIMKKHIADPPPPFSTIGVQISPRLEQAVFHTLEKDPDKRTASVEELVDEMRRAIAGDTLEQTRPSLPVSSLKIFTRPPASNVFVDNVAVGNTTDSGMLLLEGVQSGNHHLRISHDGFQDWLSDVVCDGQPRQVVAELQSAAAIPRPEQTAPIPTPFPTMPPPGLVKKKSWIFSPLVLGTVGILVLLVMGVVGLVAAYLLGFIGPTVTPGNNITTGSPTPESSRSPQNTVVKAEMIQIPGGSFKMGRNDGDIKERPEHMVTVGDLWVDKTEVTNAEYLQFVVDTKHTAPKNWSNDRPIQGTENRPVSFVDLDDANAYAAWLSKRDGVVYRLPTEEEWEYIARNGAKDNFYPWGDQWNDADAVMNVPDAEPAAVGSKPAGQNMWGVMDLIGNVWEWTSSELSAYPGANVDIRKQPGKRMIVRGGSANEDPAKLNITSTFRVDVASDLKGKNVGFRLVRPG